ncbi:hypothetical protein MNBD_BACTEROID03-1340, partial [hydrothermal vent metagenome]
MTYGPKEATPLRAGSGAIFFVMNLVKSLKIADMYPVFCAFFKKRPYPVPFEHLGV